MGRALLAAGRQTGLRGRMLSAADQEFLNGGLAYQATGRERSPRIRRPRRREAVRGPRPVATLAQTVRGIVARLSSPVAGLQATQEQTAGIGDVAHSVEQLDAMTQQNASLVEQTAAAAASLEDSARRLNGAMAYFRVA